MKLTSPINRLNKLVRRSRVLFIYILVLKAYDIEDLIGYVGGYIGLFLGVALMQIPRLISKIFKTITASSRVWRVNNVITIRMKHSNPKRALRNIRLTKIVPLRH